MGSTPLRQQQQQQQGQQDQQDQQDQQGLNQQPAPVLGQGGRAAAARLTGGSSSLAGSMQRQLSPKGAAADVPAVGDQGPSPEAAAAPPHTSDRSPGAVQLPHPAPSREGSDDDDDDWLGSEPPAGPPVNCKEYLRLLDSGVQLAWQQS